MNKTGWMILIFTAMTLAQWWIPVDMILGSNRIFEQGTPMKFRCAPVDPNDPFRGKYIVLHFEIEDFEMDTTLGLMNRQIVFLSFTRDSLGFAQIGKIDTLPPILKKDYLKTRIYINNSGFLENMVNFSSKWEVDFDIPFDRFYLEETKAPKAEDLYRTGINDTSGNTYGLVYLLNGEARIKDVIIRDTSILERLRHLNK